MREPVPGVQDLLLGNLHALMVVGEDHRLDEKPFLSKLHAPNVHHCTSLLARFNIPDHALET